MLIPDVYDVQYRLRHTTDTEYINTWLSVQDLRISDGVVNASVEVTPGAQYEVRIATIVEVNEVQYVNNSDIMGVKTPPCQGQSNISNILSRYANC